MQAIKRRIRLPRSSLAEMQSFGVNRPSMVNEQA
jgi:hypothetical protein